MLPEADCVNQLEPGVKNFIALVQNIPTVRINPLMKAHPLGCTAPNNVSVPPALVMVSGALAARVVCRLLQQSKHLAHMAVSQYLKPNNQLNQ